MDYGKEMLMTPNEIRKSLGLEPIKDIDIYAQSTKTQNNCPNCGAPITSWKCDYCDTVFEKDGLERAERARIQMDQLQTSKQIESLYKDAIKAIRNYRGIGL